MLLLVAMKELCSIKDMTATPVHQGKHLRQMEIGATAETED